MINDNKKRERSLTTTIEDYKHYNLKDWDFSKVNTKYYTHGLHSYPARMIPQIAERLILLFSQRNDKILDPFIGSGTVILESALNFRFSAGVDLNPLALLIAKVKVTPIHPDKLENECSTLKKALDQQSQRDIDEFIPHFQNIDFWFKENVIHDLTRILVNINEIAQKNEDIGDFLKVVFSNTVRDVSNTRNDEFKLYRRSKEKLDAFQPKVLPIFLEYLKNAIRMMNQYYLVCNEQYVPKKEDFHLNRTQEMPISANSVDLIVTSPPYGDSRTTVAYGQFSRLSLEFLGYKNVRTLDNQLLGGKVKRQKSELKSNTLSDLINSIDEKNSKRAEEVDYFFQDFNDCLIKIYEVVKANAHCCFVIGNRTVCGYRIPTDQIIVELAKELNFSHLTTFYRNIPTKRMPWENSPSNIKGAKGETMHKESIVILTKNS